MLSQPQSVIILIFVGIVFIFAGFGLFLLPLLGSLSFGVSILLLVLGIFALVMAGCLSRR